MRKGLLIILIIIVAYLSLTDSYDSKFIIPNEAIRLMVIPNSNSKHDQEIKTNVSKHLQYNMSNLLSDTKDINQARKIINNNIDYIDDELVELLKRDKPNLNYNINF